MKKKVIAVCLVIVAAILGLAFKDNLIRSYVAFCHENLEAYAVQFLESNEKTSSKYGTWKTSCYPDEGMVEFHTGGWGLAPSTTYTGFYYSADNTHQIFSAAYKDITVMEMDGDRATWTDGTDNHGTSIRITENWFWFEASF